MNIYSYAKNLSANAAGGFRTATTAFIASTFLLVGMQAAHANVSDEKSQLPHKVNQVLTDTEDAMAMLRIDPDKSYQLVKNALSNIEQIESAFNVKTISEEKGKQAVSYKHFYPRVDIELLQKEQTLPTLTYKLESDIVYKGNDKDLQNAYFDYSFAKASLATARDAIRADHSLEAMSNLRRVFEAIYVDPEFKVVDEPLS